jgi:hypothetical protein
LKFVTGGTKTALIDEKSDHHAARASWNPPEIAENGELQEISFFPKCSCWSGDLREDCGINDLTT